MNSSIMVISNILTYCSLIDLTCNVAYLLGFDLLFPWRVLMAGIQASVTLFDWDTPQSLEDEYGGFLSPNIVYD